MRRVFFTFAALFLLSAGYTAADDVLNITGSGNFTLMVSDSAGHHVPAIDFFRRFERVLRRVGRIEENSAGRSLLLILDEKQPSGSCRFEHSRRHRRQVLILPADYTSLLESPEAGRVIASALIQSRLGNMPQEPLPSAAHWIADGLWAEFVARERSGERIVLFTWLPGLRNIVENNGKIVLNHRTLAAPEKIRPGAAEWNFYCQKARLMLEIARDLGSSRTNLLKDYCFLLFGKQLSEEECFDQTFAVAAKRKIFTRKTPLEIMPKEEKLAGQYALERIAVKTLYSQYAPINPGTAGQFFERFCRITFRQENNNMDVEASITDLPFLVEKYTDTAVLPGIKIFELNELAASAPAQLRSDFTRLAVLLGQIGSAEPEKLSGNMKTLISNIQQKLLELQRVDAVLNAAERSMLPLLYEQRFFMYGNLPEAPLPKQTRSFIETVERSLMR